MNLYQLDKTTEEFASKWWRRNAEYLLTPSEITEVELLFRDVR